ncbi:MAG: hypothetical protein J0H35_14270, partial [Rhodospirillales bacterium]|nr:hypothetical protein [Rhodospirillales bacterium]
MAADDGEEGRQEGAAAGARVDPDHVRELLHFQDQEAQAEQAGDEQEDLGPELAARFRRHRGHAAGEAGGQQQRRLQRHMRQIEQILAARAARGGVRQHRMRREERGEHDDIAEQEDPEAEADDHPLGGWAARAVTGRLPAVAVAGGTVIRRASQLVGLGVAGVGGR